MSEQVISYKGVEYPSLTQLAKAYNIPRSTLSRRINSGMTIDDAIDGQANKSKNIIIYKGISYNSLKDLAKTYNVSYDALKKRVQCGATLEECIKNIKVPFKTEKTVEFIQDVLIYKNTKYKSIYELANSYGINSRTLTNRLQSGMSMEKALSTPVRATKKPVVHEGIAYKSVKDLAKSLGKNYNSIKYKFNSTNDDTILSKKVKSESGKSYGVPEQFKGPILYKGVYYEHLTDLARAFNIKHKVLYTRLNSGLSIEEALTLPVKTIQRENIEFNGVVYNSKRQLAKAFNVEPSLVIRKLNKEYAIEQALGLERVLNTPRQFINEHFNSLLVKGLLYTGRDGLWYFDCECKCGTHIILNNKELTEGKIISCGKCKDK